MTNQIDRAAKEPAYLQLAGILKRKIEEGVFLPGTRLPAEKQLSKEYQISPMTVRRTLQRLIDESILYAIKGSGTFVKAPNILGGYFRVKDFFDLFKDIGKTRVNIILAKIEKADEIVAKHLSLKKGDRTVHIKRLIISEGEPVIYHNEYLIYDPTRRIVEAELEVTSLHGLFEGKENDGFKWGNLSMEAVVLNSEEATLLNTTPAQAAYSLEHTFYDFSNQPVSWGRFVCRGDRLRFSTTIGLNNQS